MVCPNCAYDGGNIAIVRGEITAVNNPGFISLADDPDVIDGSGQASRVEVYYCPVCGVSFVETEFNR